jgi:hypothetical protein
MESTSSTRGLSCIRFIGATSRVQTKRDLRRLLEQEDLRATFVGDLNNHPLWP